MQTTIKQDMWTREIFYINPDTGERINNNYETGKHVDYQEGDGIVGSLASVAKKVTSKLTGKVAKDVAKKALSKAAEKGVERIHAGAKRPQNRSFRQTLLLLHIFTPNLADDLGLLSDLFKFKD